MDLITTILRWISNNAASLTLLATFFVVITLYYTLLNRKLVHLAARPALIIEPESISISPDLKCDTSFKSLDTHISENNRYYLNIGLNVSNIGNHPAHDIFIDARVFFKSRRPLGYKWLPIDKPRHLSCFPSSINHENGIKKLYICFDNFSVREILLDFSVGRMELEGLPVLATKKEMRNKNLWPSPRIIITCFYSDVQGINYKSECQAFFHLYQNDKGKKIEGSFLNMEDVGYLGIKIVRKGTKSRYLKYVRCRRYTSFWGKKFPKRELVLLGMGIIKKVKRKKIIVHETDVKSKTEPNVRVM